MTRRLAYPIRLTSSGRLASIEEQSDAFEGQQIGLLATTVIRERPWAPALGIADPVGLGVSRDELEAKLALFGVAVRITRFDVDVTDAENVRTTIEWSTP